MTQVITPPTGPSDELRNYAVAKQQVTEAVRAIKQCLETRNEAKYAEPCQALLVRLAEDRFNLAVVGQFKRGKSSLMNAIIGRELLPTGLLPLTSAITTLRYGPQEQVYLKRKGWGFKQEISLGELADYVTERGNPGNEKGLEEARVELPLPFLRRGLHFIDTPGVGSAQAANTATTYAFLPEAEAVIFVTSVEAPLSETEEKLLRDIRQHVRKLFVVVNKMDLLAALERDELLGYISAGVERALAANEFRLYPLSARQGLTAKLAGDAAGVRQSGLAAFEAALAPFLAEEKSQLFLVAILDHALRLLEEVALDGAGDAAHQLPTLRSQCETLRATLLAGLPLATSPLQTANTEILERAIAADRAPRPRGRELSAWLSHTCPICAAQVQAVFDFFAHWQYVLSTEAEARRAFAATRGFCHVHTWQFQQIASPHGISVGYALLADAAAAELWQCFGQPPEEIARRIAAILPGVETCPACRVLREAESNQLSRFLKRIPTAESQAVYVRSPGLCLPHLRAALAASPPSEVAEFLLREQVRHLEEVSEDMRSYSLKRDALRRGLLNTDEDNAWRFALLQLTGERTARVL